MSDLPRFSENNFEDACKAILSFLHKKLGFGLWMVTRTEGEDWIVLQSEDHGYDVTPGAVFRWTDSFCSEMVKGNGPFIAPDSDQVPVYKAAPIGQQVPIKSYIGYPLTGANGEMFGTLCAIDPACQPESICDELELIELLANLLSSVLEHELQLEQYARQKDQLEAQAYTDDMTSLYNRRAWDQFITTEEERCRRFGHPASVFIVDLNGLKRINDTQGHAAGDDYIKRTANTLKRVTRDSDIVARLGGDEFGILCVECDAKVAASLRIRIQKLLDDAGISAAIGLATRSPEMGLVNACEEADHSMYQEKKHKAALS